MNSVLGTIQLGGWELGQVGSPAVTTGAFTATANPRVGLTAVGGVPGAYTSVLGTIRLGIFQLGQIPSGSVTSGETIGKGSFLGKAFPTVVAAPSRALSASFTGSAFPTCVARGNKGPLLISFAFFPEVSAAGIFYYADGSFACSPDPTVTVQGLQKGSVVFSAFPEVTVSPLIGQPVSCVVGPNPADAEFPNFVY